MLPDPGPDGKSPQGRCAFQGALGAFSHEACLDLRPWDEPTPFETFEAALAAAERGEAGCALIPVENSTIGRVEPAATLIERSRLTVICEVWRPIRLSLMAPHGARLRGIRTAESHPAALGQCVATLRSLGIAPVKAFDTAGAARAVAEAGDLSRAAVGPARAAEVYGLTILRGDLQDSPDNRTRFLLVSRDEA